jgi:hypothetical protein
MGGIRFRVVWPAKERAKGGGRVAPGASACAGSVRLGSSGAAAGRKLLGMGSPVIEYAVAIDTIEKVMVYV